MGVETPAALPPIAENADKLNVQRTTPVYWARSTVDASRLAGFGVETPRCRTTGIWLVVNQPSAASSIRPAVTDADQMPLEFAFPERLTGVKAAVVVLSSPSSVRIAAGLWPP